MQGWMLWFALTAAFCLMGIGMASWQNDLDVNAGMGTAHIGIEFIDEYNSLRYEIITDPPDDWEGTTASASISRKNIKELEIMINNAYPGLKVYFWYEIANTGSLPVIITSHNVASSHSGVSVVSTLSDMKIDIDGFASGEIIVTINDVDPQSTYDFSLQIGFEPDL